MLVATLARGDELDHPFWISSITEIIKDKENNQVMSIVVHWYDTSSPDAFIVKYSLEMVTDVGGTSRKRRRKNLLSTFTLTLHNVDILVYDFSLAKRGHSRQITIKIIKEKIIDVPLDATQRRTRSMSHNHSDIGLQLNEDNVLVANDNEDETSRSSSSSSDGYEGEGIALGSDSFNI